MAADLDARASSALELASSDPLRGRRLAEAVLADHPRDPAVRATALHALGVALAQRGEVVDATAALRRAIALAQRTGQPAREGLARTSLVYALALRGRVAAAVREADATYALVGGVDRARLVAQRALLHQRVGRHREALADFRRALPVLQEADDHEWVYCILNNRAILHTYRGAVPDALADLDAAGALVRSLGLAYAEATVEHNRGFTLARAGDVPAALAAFDAAETRLRALEAPLGAALVDRADVLLSVHLVDEAGRAARAATEQFAASSLGTDLAEARLLLAEALLLSGDVDGCRHEAALAQRAFARQGRAPWAALAAGVMLRADGEEGQLTASLARRARRVADQLAAHGLVEPALDARLLAARAALAVGQTDAARRDLALVRRRRHHGPLRRRAKAFYGEALHQVAAGRFAAADGALRQGVELLEQHRDLLGATELRAHASADAAPLAQLGLQLALADGAPERVLAWAERWRADSLRRRPVRPPDDEELASELTELRAVVSEANEAVLAGAPTAALHERQVALEARIARRRRRTAAPEEIERRAETHAEALLAALGSDREMHELIEADGRMWSVVLAGGTVRLVDRADAADVATEVDHLRFALARATRAATARPDAAATDRAAAAISVAARRVEGLLFAGELDPARGTDAGALVLVPTADLHRVPWGVLPSFRARPFSVSPSASVWLRAGRPRASGRGIVLVAGPDLPGAEAEIAVLARLLPEARVLTGASAGADEVRRAIDGAALVHIAAHGSFRADNPLFSSLRLADGPLTVHDLERLERAPHVLVLSACDSGRSATRPGEEVMGLAAALLALGTASAVTSVLPVPDAETGPFMLAFHRALAVGAPPAAALARARAVTAGEGDSSASASASMVVASSFACFGA